MLEPISEPMVTLVVELAVFDVPMLIAWVALPPMLDPMLIVLLAVERPMVVVPVWAVPPSAMVPVVVDVPMS